MSAIAVPPRLLTWARQVTDGPTLELSPVSNDASFRQYWRTEGLPAPLIVMDSPPAQENPLPWLQIGQTLAAAGLHVPAVYAADLEQGLLLIEDLGSRLYLDELRADTADALYAAALKALLRMQLKADSTALAPYDRAFMQREIALLPEWFLGRHLAHVPTEGEQQLLQASGDWLLDEVQAQPSSFVHRDFHSRNLLHLPARLDSAADAANRPTKAAQTTLHTPGIIDFQGALLGPITYDLASLLRDCYITWPQARVEAWMSRHYRQLLAHERIDAGIDLALFRRWFDLTGLQRHLKVLGLFCRLAYRDGKPQYLAELPRVYAYVQATLHRYPELGALGEWLEAVRGGHALDRQRANA